MSRRLFSLAIAAVLMGALFLVLGTPRDGVLAHPSLTPHDPIRITGNEEFTPSNGVTGGSGTPGDPYVIEGWEIGPATSGISIDSTNASFIIRNVHVHSVSTTFVGSINLFNVANGVIQNVNLSGNVLAVKVQSSENVTFQLSDISNNGFGFSLESSQNVRILENQINHTQGYGLSLYQSTGITVAENNFTQSGVHLYGTSVSHFNSHNMSSGNSVNGKPLLFYKDCDNLSLDGIAAGQIVVANCSNVEVANVNISNTYAAMVMGFVDHVLLESNNFSSNSYGALLRSASNTTIVRNTLSSNDASGILIQWGESLAISENTILSNAELGVGLDYIGGNATVLGNNISGNNVGIQLLDSSGVGIIRNEVSGNQLGLAFYSGSEAIRVAHNNIIDNNNQATDAAGSVNSWDDGYPSGGNYWSNYPGLDDCSGPVQDVCPDADGMGDSPYVIDADTSDHYPVMNPIDRDNGHPTAVFVATPAAGNATTLFTLNASLSHDPEDPVETLDFRWDWEGDWAWDTNWSAETETSHAYEASGRYMTRLMVRDGGGLLNATTREILVDGAPPFTSATLAGVAGQDGWFLSPISVTLTPTDELAGVASTEYRVDGDSWQNYTMPFVVSAEGTHSVDYRSTDKLGNTEAVKTVEAKLDTAPPATAISLTGTVGQNGWFVSAVNATLTASDSTSGVHGTLYRVNGGSWADYTGTIVLGTEGEATLEYYSVDIAGNEESVQQDVVRVDLQLPDLTFLSPEEGSWHSQKDLTVLWNGSDEASGVDRYQVEVDGGPVRVLTEGRLDLAGLAEGAHSVRVVVFDRAGHSNTFVHTFGVDLKSPAVTVVSPSNHSHHVQKTVMVAWQASDALSGVANCFFSWDGEDEVSVGETSPYALELSDGTHEVVVRCTDLAGNSGEATLSLSVDSNLFSPAGPYGPWLLIALIVIPIASGLVILLWYRRTHAERPPKARK